MGGKFIATLQCFVKNLLMHPNGKVCVFFIKMLHSINPIRRKDTGGGLGTPLRKLSFLSLEPSCPLALEVASPQPVSPPPPWLSFPEGKKYFFFSLTIPEEKPQRA